MRARSPTAGHAPRCWPPRAGPYLASLSVLRGARAQHSEVAAAADLDALADGLLVGVFARPALGLGLHDRVGQRLQVVGALLARVHRQPPPVPPPRPPHPLPALFPPPIP